MKPLLSFAFGFFFLAGLYSPAFAQPSFPEPTGFVNDFADILSPEAEADIQALIETIQTETSAEVAVVTVQSLDGYEENYYAVELGRAWGVGNAERDDGVVFLTAVEDRITYIATGYGVEEYITDAQAFWITDRVVVPFFKNGDFDTGIQSGVEQIKAALVDLEALPEASGGLTSSFSIFDWFFVVFFLFSFVFPWAVAVLGRSKAWWPGGIIGGVVGYVVVLLFSLTLLVLIPFILFGFFFDYLASTNFKKGKSRWYTGGGRNGWGGGSSGWGSGGSSFGGFSGGSFGGGGGGSSW